MSGNKGAALILAAGVFGLGWLAAPDVRIEEKTNTDIKLIRVPDTHVVTKTKTVTKDLPSVCKTVANLNANYSALLNEQARLLGESPDLVSDARLSIYEKDYPATTDVLEKFADIQEKNFNLITRLHEVGSRLTIAVKDCEKATK